MADTRFSLAVDLGNSTTELGFFLGEELISTYTVTTQSRMTVDEAWSNAASFLRFVSREDLPANLAGDMQLTDAIVSSVVPDLTDPWVEALNRLCGCEPLIVGPGLKTGIRMHYKDPGEIGGDRIADLVAALHTYECPFIVVDLGTTTNLEIIDRDGYFVGGIIAPGLHLAATALAEAAARLPVVDIKAPSSLIGKSTKEAMQAGVVLGEVARIDGLITMVWDELGYKSDVIATGSDALVLAALSEHINVTDEYLTLRGLRILLDMNRR